uniref:Immunoglobulin domain-containing protein n=1 Tax=Oncorhynchus mykiss TaxID=8022 RepID=A0A8K9X458_ONCMY
IIHCLCNFVFILIFNPCLFGFTVCALNKDIVQPNPVMVTHRGASVNITCFWPTDVNTDVVWFKQTLGQKPLLMTSTLSSGQYFYFNNFTKNFTETKHLSVKKGVDSFNLTISKTEPWDSATYYCGAMKVGKVKFGDGTLLIVKGKYNLNTMILLRHSLQVQSPTTCAGEHRVFWFRHGSGESRPGILYTNRDRSDQCENCTEAGSPTQSCVYNLPKRNLSLSDAGTYYCAVASCGEILFGNGTKLDVDPLALCVILIIVLAYVLYKMIKKTSLLCRGKRYHCQQYMIKMLVRFTICFSHETDCMMMIPSCVLLKGKHPQTSGLAVTGSHTQVCRP